MLSHDELAHCIKHQYPDAIHMFDFYVAMPVEASTGQQTGQAFIADWLLEAPRPTPEEIDTYETLYADILAAFRQPNANAVDAEPGNLAWQRLLDPNAPPEFRWIAADNTTHAMDAQTAMQFGYAALNHKQAHIFAARALKNMAPIPADFAMNPAYWP